MNSQTYRPRRASEKEKAAALSFHDPAAERREYDKQMARAAQDEMTRDSLRALEEAGRKVGDAGQHAPVVEQHHEVVDEADQHRLHDEATEVRHQLGGEVAQYVLAGNATVTIVSKGSGKRFTFKFSRAKTKGDAAQDEQRPWFVSVLNGPDNENSFAYIGCVWPRDRATLKPSAKSVIAMEAPSAKAATWFVQGMHSPDKLLTLCEVWHEGRCGRCGRKLTVPSSIASGIGPECAKRGEA